MIRIVEYRVFFPSLVNDVKKDNARRHNHNKFQPDKRIKESKIKQTAIICSAYTLRTSSLRMPKKPIISPEYVDDSEESSLSDAPGVDLAFSETELSTLNMPVMVQPNVEQLEVEQPNLIPLQPIQLEDIPSVEMPLQLSQRNRKGPNLKFTKRKGRESKDLSPTSARAWEPTPCQDCQGACFRHRSSLVRHYASQHYKHWEHLGSLFRDMTPEERRQQEALKLRGHTKNVTSAVPLSSEFTSSEEGRSGNSSADKKFPKPGRSKIPSAQATNAQPIKPYIGPLEVWKLPARLSPLAASCDLSKGIPVPRIDATREGRTEDPTIRHPTRPRMLMAPPRRPEILHPVATSVGIPTIQPRTTSVENLYSLPKVSNDEDRGKEDEPIIIDAQEPDWNQPTTSKDGRSSISTVSSLIPRTCKIPTLDTLRYLLLHGVAAAMRKLKRTSNPPLTTAEEDYFETMYNTMLQTVPLVRELEEQE